MMDKPEALWLANELPWVKHTADWVVCNLAAAELRRLQIQNAELTENLERKSTAIQRIWKERDDLRKQRGVLLEALNNLVDHIDLIPTDPYYRDETRQLINAARAAIKAVEENT
jgi:hypothetical protein